MATHQDPPVGDHPELPIAFAIWPLRQYRLAPSCPALIRISLQGLVKSEFIDCRALRDLNYG
jgi:hypothetical protein